MRRFFTIILQILVSFFLLEIAARLLVKEYNGQDFFLGKKWRYVLPFQYANTPSHLENSNNYRIYDSLLGWSVGKSARDGIYMSNFRGMRCSLEEFNNDTCASMHYPFLAIGNSFTHGDAVNYEDTWVSQISKRLETNIGNLGVGGYGIDQALLRLMTSGLKCDTVIFGLVSGDLERAVYPVYNFYTGGVKTKPMFLFENDTFSLFNVPCLKPEILVRDRQIENSLARDIFDRVPGGNAQLYWEQSPFRFSSAIRVFASSIHKLKYGSSAPIYISPQDSNYLYVLNVFWTFKKFCNHHNIEPIVLLIDEGNSLGPRLTNEIIGNSWDQLSNDLHELGLNVLEFQDSALSLHRKGGLIHPEEGVHLSAMGNRLYSDLIYRSLRQYKR